MARAIVGREAAQPFEQSTPVDAINVALVDEMFYSPFEKRMAAKKT